MNTQQQTFLRYAIIPLIALAVLLIYLLIIHIFDLPDFEALIEISKVYYETHGYWVIIIAALLEGFLFLNWYFPGSVVLAFGMVLTAESSLSPTITASLIMLGFYATAILNYALGKYGFYKLFLKLGLKKSLEKMQIKMEKYGLPLILSSYFHPNVGALAATSAGILQLSFKKFLLYALISIIIWNALFATIVYYSGPAILKILSTQGMIVIFAIWLTASALLYFKKSRNKATSTTSPS